MKSLVAWSALLLAAFAWRGCSGDSKPGPKPLPSADGGSAGDAGGERACERACARLTELGCPEAEPTPGGATCVDVCENTEGSAVVSLDPDCVAHLRACSELDACTGAPTE